MASTRPREATVLGSGGSLLYIQQQKSFACSCLITTCRQEGRSEHMGRGMGDGRGRWEMGDRRWVMGEGDNRGEMGDKRGRGETGDGR